MLSDCGILHPNLGTVFKRSVVIDSDQRVGAPFFFLFFSSALPLFSVGQGRAEGYVLLNRSAKRKPFSFVRPTAKTTANWGLCKQAGCARIKAVVLK